MGAQRRRGIVMDRTQLGLWLSVLLTVSCASDDEVDLGVDTTSAFPSCESGPLCGADRESCCTALEVPQGTMVMGDELSRPGGQLEAFAVDEDAGASVEVGDFLLERYEVSVARFRRFVGAYAEGWRPEPGAGQSSDARVPGWSEDLDAELPEDEEELIARLHCDDLVATYTTSPTARDNRPINCVSFPLAYAFCIWDGGRLPSEQEWEYAAAGGDEERMLPSGAAFPATPEQGAFSCLHDGDSSCMESDIPNVGSYPEGEARWGHLDLVGSMTEWTATVYREVYFDDLDVIGSTASFRARTVRGGSWLDPYVHLRAASRDYAEPSLRSYSLGFRCARNVED